MKVPRKQLAGIVAQQTLAGGFGRAHVRSLAAYLLETGRTSEVDSLLRDVRQAWAERGYVDVTAASARPLAPSAERSIVAEVRSVYPEAKRIAVTPHIDSALVGGVRLDFAGHQLDLSIAGELQQFKTLAAHGKD